MTRTNARRRSNALLWLIAINFFFAVPALTQPFESIDIYSPRNNSQIYIVRNKNTNDKAYVNRNLSFLYDAGTKKKITDFYHAIFDYRIESNFIFVLGMTAKQGNNELSITLDKIDAATVKVVASEQLQALHYYKFDTRGYVGVTLKTGEKLYLKYDLTRLTPFKIYDNGVARTAFLYPTSADLPSFYFRQELKKPGTADKRSRFSCVQLITPNDPRGLPVEDSASARIQPNNKCILLKYSGFYKYYAQNVAVNPVTTDSTRSFPRAADFTETNKEMTYAWEDSKHYYWVGADLAITPVELPPNYTIEQIKPTYQKEQFLVQLRSDVRGSSPFWVFVKPGKGIIDTSSQFDFEDLEPVSPSFYVTQPTKNANLNISFYQRPASPGKKVNEGWSIKKQLDLDEFNSVVVTDAGAQVVNKLFSTMYLFELNGDDLNNFRQVPDKVARSMQLRKNLVGVKDFNDGMWDLYNNRQLLSVEGASGGFSYIAPFVEISQAWYAAVGVPTYDRAGYRQQYLKSENNQFKLVTADEIFK